MVQCHHVHPHDGKRCEQPAKHVGSCDHSHNGKTAIRWWPETSAPSVSLPDFLNAPGYRKTPKGGNR